MTDKLKRLKDVVGEHWTFESLIIHLKKRNFSKALPVESRGAIENVTYNANLTSNKNTANVLHSAYQDRTFQQ